MAIKSGLTASADEVMNMAGKLFKNQAQLIFNADLIGLDSDLDEEYENLKRDAFATTTNIDSTNSYIKDVPVFGANVMDDFQDASIDANIWSTAGTVAETGGYLTTTTSAGSSYALANQVNGEDFNDDCTIFIFLDSAGSSVDHNTDIKLVDESANEVYLKNYNSTNVNGLQCRIEISPGTNEAFVYDNFTGTGSPATVNITSLTDGNEWHIKLQARTNGTDCQANFYFVRFLRNAVVSKDFISSVTTSGSTITDAILVVNKTIAGTASATYYLSADNGANYEAVTLNQIHRFTNTGTQLKVKVTMTNDASDNIYELNHYAVWYNTGAS